MYEIIIRNGNVIDGTGKPAFRADIAIDGGRIMAIGDLSAYRGKDEYDADGKYVVPGFIDIHTHSDKTLETYPRAESRILQGVTTEVGGNCGISPFPINPEYIEDLKVYEGGNLTWKWNDISSFLDYMEDVGTSTNFGCLAGHGSIRMAVMGYSADEASKDQLMAMRKLAAETIRGGALGISSGLIYPPGSYSNTSEMIYVLDALKENGGFYATHMRNERENLVESVQESIHVAKEAGVPLEISHHKSLHAPLHGIAVKETTRLIEEAIESGLDVKCDQYPYSASATTLSSDIPYWAFEGGFDELVKRLRDPATRARLKEEADASHEGRWQNISVSYLASEKNKWMIGKFVTEIGQILGKSPADVVFDLVDEEHNQVNEVDFGMSEDDIEFIMQKPYVMPGSDGEAYSLDFPGQPHPRNFGTFPRIIAYYCRDGKLFTLEEAIRKMTSLPADRIGIDDRGRIQEGMWADIVVFDFENLQSLPTYENPKQPCAGIDYVFVNGVLTAEKGIHTGARAGKIVRH